MRTSLPIFLEGPGTVREWRIPGLLTLLGRKEGRGGTRAVSSLGGYWSHPNAALERWLKV